MIAIEVSGGGALKLAEVVRSANKLAKIIGPVTVRLVRVRWTADTKVEVGKDVTIREGRGSPLLLDPDYRAGFGLEARR